MGLLSTETSKETIFFILFLPRAWRQRIGKRQVDSVSVGIRWLLYLDRPLLSPGILVGRYRDTGWMTTRRHQSQIIFESLYLLFRFGQWCEMGKGMIDCHGNPGQHTASRVVRCCRPIVIPCASPLACRCVREISGLKRALLGHKIHSMPFLGREFGGVMAW